MLTYNQILKISRSFQQAHHVLKNFGNGGEWDRVVHNQQPAYKYPLMWMDDLPSLLFEGAEVYSFRVAFMAPVVTLKDRDSDLMSTNVNEVKSDMIQCSNDFIAYWVGQTDAYDGLVLEKSISRTTFEDVTDDKLAGCYIDITFRQAFDYNSCSVPMGTPTSLPDTCAPVLIYEDGVLVDTIPSGGTYSYSSGGGVASQTFNGGAVTDQDSGTTKVITVKDSGGNNVGTKGTDNALALAIQIADATQTMNGSAITSQLPETAKAFTIRYANNDPVTVTTITDTDTSFIGEVPDVVVPLNTANPFKTGQTTSYVTKDDGDLERGNGASFTTLSHNNYFGNTNRFTDTLGGQTYANGFIIDWSTYNQITGAFIMWYNVYEAAATWTNALAAQPYTRGVYADWYIPNESELYNILNRGVSPSTNYAPFNLNVTAANNGLWTSTTIPNNTAAAYFFSGTTSNNSIAGSSKTANQRFVLMRYGNISEL